MLGKIERLFMKILLVVPMRSFTGEVIKDGEADLMLRSVLLSALSRGGDQNATYTEKSLQFSLGVKIASAGDEVELISDEIKMLKDITAKIFSSLIVGQVGKLLEGQLTGISPQPEVKE